MVSNVNPDQTFTTTFQTKVEGKQEVTKLSGDLAALKKDLQGFERNRQLLQVARDAAEITREGGSARKAMVALYGSIAKLDDISRDEIKTVAKEFDRVTQSIKQAEAAEEALNDRITKTLDLRIREQASAGRAGGVAAAGGANPLTDIGFQLRSLPSTAIPGAGGLSTDAVGNILRLIGGISGPDGLPRLSTVLEGVSSTVGTVVKAIGVGPLALGVVLAGLAIVLQKVAEAGAKVQEQIGGQISAAQDIAALRITSTIPDVVEHLKNLNTEMEVAAAKTGVAEQAMREVAQQLLGSEGLELGLQELRLVLASMNIPVGELGNAMVKATTEFDEAKAAQDELSLELSAWNVLLNDARVLQNTANEALEEQNRLLEERNNQRSLNALQDEIALNNLSADSLQKRIDALAAEKEDIEAAIAAGSFTGEVLVQQQQRVDDIVDTLGRFILALPEKQEADENAKAFEYLKQQMKDTAAAVEDYNKKVEASTLQRAQREYDILNKLNDNIIKAAEKAAEDSQRALEKLEQQRADLGTDLARGERDAAREAQLEDLESRIKYQRDEAKSYRDHLRNLRDIREDAQAQEEELGRNRDFAGLRRLSLETNRNLKNETRAFREQQAERELSFAQLIEDEQRRREFEHESRLIRYEDALADAEQDYQRQQALIDRNQQRQVAALRNAAIAELNLNNQKHQQNLSMLHSAITAELAIVSQGQKARLAMEAQHQQALLAQARAIQAQSYVANLGNSGINSSTGRGNTTNNTVNSNINLYGGNSQAQQKAIERIVDNRLAAAFSRVAY